MKNLSWNNDYATGNLSNYLYHQNYYKRIGIDLSRRTNLIVVQQIIFIIKLDEDDGEKLL